MAFSATYTFLNQYATITPDGVRHNQTSGRLDFSGTYVAYDNEKTAGSFSLLVRSGTNIGYSQQWNLSDALGSGVFLNCLQGGGAQRPITLNILYYRQDFLAKRLSIYAGKIHPNEYVSLSMYNNDERTQFLNGENDGNLAIASDGTYAGGGAVEFQATKHLYFHLVAVDTEGSQQANLKTMADLKYLEALETGWFSGYAGHELPELPLHSVARRHQEPWAAAMAEALPLSMNFLMAGRRLPASDWRPTPEPRSSKQIPLVSRRLIRGAGGAICSERRSATPSRALRANITRASSRSFYRLRATQEHQHRAGS